MKDKQSQRCKAVMTTPTWFTLHRILLFSDFKSHRGHVALKASRHPYVDDASFLRISTTSTTTICLETDGEEENGDHLPSTVSYFSDASYLRIPTTSNKTMSWDGQQRGERWLSATNSRNASFLRRLTKKSSMKLQDTMNPSSSLGKSVHLPRQSFLVQIHG